MTPFVSWYFDLRGRTPWPWQILLADQIADGKYPSTLAIPTGCGKTTIIDIWGWAISQGCPVARRLYWCIDRRVVVAQTSKFAKSLHGCVPDLQLAELRGGQSIDVDGIVDPSLPAVMITTVDQLGSRLLWRPYGGISRYAAPIHAGLVGNDALIVLDEAHLSEPFASTLKAVEQMRGSAISLPWHIVQLTATPRTEGGFQLDPDDYSDPILSRRLAAPKVPSVQSVGEGTFVEAMISAALKRRAEGAAVVGIVVNTVRDARKIFAGVRQHGDSTLIIGRVRPPERERRLADLDRIATRTRSIDRAPVFVVATSAIEVGADIDLDALITQTCRVSSLIQRLGRLNRAGDLALAPVSIVHIHREPGHKRREEEDCLKWAKAQSDLSPKSLAGLARPEEPSPEFPPLLASDIDLLAQTTVPIPIDISPWLHGFEADTECFLAWRNLPEEDPLGYMEAVPVARREIMSCPIGSLIPWLRQQSVDYLVKGNNEWDTNGTVFPGSLVVLPAEIGGYDEYGWAPDSRVPVVDVSLEDDRYLVTDPDQLEAWELGELNLPEKATVRSWAGGLCVYAKPWNDLPDSEPTGPVTLSDHLFDVADEAKRMAVRLPGYLMDCVVNAAKTHDVGKSDDRFQILLGAGAIPLAKSATRSDTEAATARALSGLPRGWRHEMLSAAMLEGRDELIRYLVATHHGRGRSLLPAAPDSDLWRSAGGEEWHHVWARQSAELGHWGLAYLEVLVRLSDWSASGEAGA